MQNLKYKEFYFSAQKTQENSKVFHLPEKSFKSLIVLQIGNRTVLAPFFTSKEENIKEQITRLFTLERLFLG